MRFVVTGGGTGGHIYPALAVAEGLREALPTADVLYIGSATGLEEDIVQRAGVAFAAVPAAGMAGKSAFVRLKGAFTLLRGTLRALRLLHRFRPAAVVGTGGYVSAPVVFAAHLLSIPVALQEQNALPGAANRLLSRYAQFVLLPFGEAKPHFAHHPGVRVTGNPVRREVMEATRAAGRAALGLPDAASVLFVFGGSRGAANIHAAMADALPQLLARPTLHVLYITGEAYADEVRQSLASRGIADNPRLRVMPYAHNVAELLAAADLAVVRAGAMTVAELAVRGLPSIVVPSPNVVNDHQTYNARILSDAGAAVLMADNDLTGDTLVAALAPLLDDNARLAKMAAAAKTVAKPDALQNIVAYVLELAGEQEKGG